MRDWLVSYYPLRTEEGLIRYVGTVCLEITDLKKVENDLRERKELLRNVIDHIPCGVIWKDRDGVHQGCNQLAASDLGFATPADFLHTSETGLPLIREEAESFRRFDLEVMGTGQPRLNFEETLTKPDGSRLELLTSKVPLPAPRGRLSACWASTWTSPPANGQKLSCFRPSPPPKRPARPRVNS